MNFQRPKILEIPSGVNSQISPPVTVNEFPDEILLKIFDFCREASMETPSVLVWADPASWLGAWPRTWRKLAQVCQRWRYVMFSSPLRLYLRVYCTERTLLRDTLDVWPPFPIQIFSYGLGDNVIAAFEHSDRIGEIDLRLPYAEFERLDTVIMQKPFPALTSLLLQASPHQLYSAPVRLEVSAPRLQSLYLENLPCPTLPELLFSFNDLSELYLLDLHYVSPEAMATGLSALTKLTFLHIEFLDDIPELATPLPPPLTRAVLPALTEFQFWGLDEYSEDLFARVDAPQLKTLSVVFLKQTVSNIRQVIYHVWTLGSFNRAEVTLGYYYVNIRLYQLEGAKAFELDIKDQFQHAKSGWQVSSMTQICTQASFLLSSIRELNILNDPSSSVCDFEVVMDDSEWLELFRPFTTVRTLRLPGELPLHIVSSLQELTMQDVTEVLPALQNLYIRKYSGGEYRDEQQSIWLFFAQSQHSDHPITL